MRIYLFLLLCLVIFSGSSDHLDAQSLTGNSLYLSRLDDTAAVYFTPENFHFQGGVKEDVSDALQRAVNQVKRMHNFGILFIPEGTYLITKTIYIPKAIRLIGYGKKRPEIILERHSPGFQIPDTSDKGHASYMFWFTADTVIAQSPGAVHTAGAGKPAGAVNTAGAAKAAVKDANAGTFYSAMSNINLRIEDGNPVAVALRTHYAQHSFISHVDIHTDNGLSGIFDAGNELEDVRFYGGEYGIYTTKPSPGWPFMMVDTYFTGQRRAAIRTQEAGLTIVRMQVKNDLSVIEIDPEFNEKLFLKDCRFDNIEKAAIVISQENNANNQINIQNLNCRKVPLLVKFRKSGKEVNGPGLMYKVRSFTRGLQLAGLGAEGVMKTSSEIKVLHELPDPVVSDIPDYLQAGSWVNLRTLGAKGDGTTDDTRILQDAINRFKTIYIPQGWYLVSETIKLHMNTVLIGLNPVATQLMLKDNTEAFAGFGPPRALLEVPQNGVNIVSGIGLNTGGQNPRAVGCKWMAGPASYMNDVKFIGGHGTMNRDGSNAPSYNTSHSGDPNPNRKWDSQYWSLWITSGGGGVFKDIWTANTFSAAGLYISNTSTKGTIYALSSEHHVRNEVMLKNVSNWDLYALQTEEEIAESSHCQPLELENCSAIRFANLYMFRVIWLVTPYPYAIRTNSCRDLLFMNVHNFSQIKYTIDNTLLDVHSGREVRPWEFAKLTVAAPVFPKPESVPASDVPEKLAGGFEFADAICTDSKGDIYFSDSRPMRIYKWSVKTRMLSLVTQMPFKPLSLACDKNDQLLVVTEYTPQKGALLNGRPEIYTKPADAKGTSYGVWYNTGSTVKVFAIDPAKPELTIHELLPVPMDDIKHPYRVLYPANRWRDGSDFLDISQQRSLMCFKAPDGVTIIPVAYDLIRSNALLAAIPGKPFYAADEYGKRTVRFDVSAAGYLNNPIVFAERGEDNTAVDLYGNIYIPDGQIYVYDKDGKQRTEIKVPERPATIAFGGSDAKTLFITARSSLYSIKLHSEVKK